MAAPVQHRSRAWCWERVLGCLEAAARWFDSGECRPRFARRSLSIRGMKNQEEWSAWHQQQPAWRPSLPAASPCLRPCGRGASACARPLPRVPTNGTLQVRLLPEVDWAPLDWDEAEALAGTLDQHELLLGLYVMPQAQLCSTTDRPATGDSISLAVGTWHVIGADDAGLPAGATRGGGCAGLAEAARGPSGLPATQPSPGDPRACTADGRALPSNSVAGEGPDPGVDAAASADESVESIAAAVAREAVDAAVAAAAAAAGGPSPGAETCTPAAAAASCVTAAGTACVPWPGRPAACWTTRTCPLHPLLLVPPAMACAVDVSRLGTGDGSPDEDASCTSLLLGLDDGRQLRWPPEPTTARDSPGKPAQVSPLLLERQWFRQG